MKISFKVIVLGALLAAGTSLYAQGASPHPSGSNHIDVSTLKGTVQGASGAVHPVTITATNLTNGQKHTVTATSGGGFVFNNLPDGNYKVVVEAPNRHPYVVNEVKLRAEPLNLLLKLGEPIHKLMTNPH